MTLEFSLADVSRVDLLVDSRALGRWAIGKDEDETAPHLFDDDDGDDEEDEGRGDLPWEPAPARDMSPPRTARDLFGALAGKAGVLLQFPTRRAAAVALAQHWRETHDSAERRA